MVSAQGIGSGLDINLIISQLMENEARPLNSLKHQESFYQSQLSAYGKLKNSLSSFQEKIQKLNDKNVFAIHKSDSSDEDFLTATTTENATHGKHNVNVVQLAQAHKLASIGFSDATSSIIATGTLELAVNGESFQVVVDSSNGSLTNIKDAINDAADNVGVKASLIHVDDGLGGTESRLILSSEETGAANTISLTDISGNVAATLSSSTTITAQDASLVIDGFNVTRAKNVIDDALEGVTLTLYEAGKTVELDITRDTDAIKDSVQQFIDAYNSLVNDITKFQDNELSNDFGLNSVKLQFRGILNSLVEDVGAYQLLSEIGVKTKTVGAQAKQELTLDADLLLDALNSNFSSVANLFASDDVGIATLFDNAITELLSKDGILKIREDGIDRRIKTLSTQMERQETRLGRLEESYVRQFGALDSMLGQLQSTNIFLTQQLAQIQGLKINKS